jgi:hypothetical protein
MINESLDVFFVDFGVEVVKGSVKGVGILDAPTNVISDGSILTTDYLLTVQSSKFPNCLYGDSITVAGIAYKVRESRQTDDGKLTEILLMKV